MRVVFLGTPEAAVPSLLALVNAGYDVVTVVTRPDRRRGRGSELSPSPVKAAALAHNIPVVHRVADLAHVTVDIGVVVAYGAMIPEGVLERIPMLNVHFSLLPRWRGAAPVERALLAGDVETGVGIMTLEKTLDTGPIHAESRLLIGSKTASQLTDELAQVGAGLLVKVLDSPTLLASPRPQVGESTYAEKLTPDTFKLTPDRSATYAERVVRLERAWCMVGEKRLRVLAARIGTDRGVPGAIAVEGSAVALGFADGTLVLEAVQPEGSKAMPAAAWWAGARLGPDATWH